MRRNHNLLIGEATAERIKKEVGIAKPPTDGVGKTVHIKGRDLVNGVPKEISINQGQIAEALSNRSGRSSRASGSHWRIRRRSYRRHLRPGIVLTGWRTSSGPDEVLRDETGLPVTVAEDLLFSSRSGYRTSAGGRAVPRRSSDRLEKGLERCRRVGRAQAGPGARNTAVLQLPLAGMSGLIIGIVMLGLSLVAPKSYAFRERRRWMQPRP